MARRDDAGEVDEALLRVIAQRLGALLLVDTVDVFPAGKPSAIVAVFDDQYFPPGYRQVFLEVRAFTNGDLSITYREESDGDAWQCRWDRHENPHSARDHFHPPRPRRAPVTPSTVITRLTCWPSSRSSSAKSTTAWARSGTLHEGGVRVRTLSNLTGPRGELAAVRAAGRPAFEFDQPSGVGPPAG